MDDLFPADEDLILFALWGLIIFPWTVRAFAHAWVPLPQRFLAPRPRFRRVALLAWRFLLLVVTVDAAIEASLLFDSFGPALLPVFAWLGWYLNRCGVPWPPLLLGVLTGSALAESARRALSADGGDSLMLLLRPAIAVTVVIAIAMAAFRIHRWRRLRASAQT